MPFGISVHIYIYRTFVGAHFFGVLFLGWWRCLWRKNVTAVSMTM